MPCGMLIQPPMQVEEPQNPLIFLAGPIQGAPDWQALAPHFIWAGDEYVNIASPRRPLKFEGKFSGRMYEEQVRWEHEYLRRAGERGVVLFWLAREAEHRCDRAYAQTTRFELGEACVLHATRGYKVVVGIEEGFSNARYIRMTLGAKYPNIPLADTLEETCFLAVNLL